MLIPPSESELLDRSASPRARLLFLCQRNPWHLDNGGIIRNYWLLRALSLHYDVDLVTAGDAHEAVPAAFADRCSGIYRFPQLHGPGGRLTKALRALRFESAFVISGNVTGAMRNAVRRLVEGRDYSAVITELGLIDALPRDSPPIVYAAHNCETSLLRRRAVLEPFAVRTAMALDALRLRRFERRAVDRALLVTACSQNDLDELSRFAPAVKPKGVVIPNGVDCATYAATAGVTAGQPVILLTGSFDWLPNQRGLMWFLETVLPLIEERLGSLPFGVRVAGRMSADFARKITRRSARVTARPNVDDMSVELRAASLVAAPVLASSGTRLRILEAWAAGRPVVTTPAGAFGLDCTNGEDLFICSDAERFADAAAALLTDEALRAKMRTAGLTRAAAHDWLPIGAAFVRSMEASGIRTTRPSGPERPCAATATLRASRASMKVAPRS